MRVYAFDVDHTLEVSNGPVTLQSLVALRNEGHVVGLCGNWGVFFNAVPNWYNLIQFFNYGQVKNVFLHELKTRFIPGAEDYVMVGNIGLIDERTFHISATGGSDDMSQALGANWRFLTEKQFSLGQR